jgi:regulator of sigma E protease
LSDLLLFVVVLGALIVGHEFGHFAAARALGVKVEEFGIGFPPRLFTLFTVGGTRFTFNLIPLGGFVRPAGEDDPSVDEGLAAAPKKVRAAVLIAGPLANVFLALIAFTLAFKFAAPDFERVLVTGVVSNTPAEAAGLQPLDLVISVDDQPIASFQEMQQAIGERLGETVVISVEREGLLQDYELIPRVSPPNGQGPIGVTLGNPTRDVGWLEAFDLGTNTAALQIRELVLLPSRIFNGELEPAEARVSGLKGMYDMLVWAGQIDRSSQRPFLTLNLVGVISVGLALANLLPFLALDGGRLMFIGIETALRRRIAPHYEGLAHTVGFLILLGLIIYINLQDFINPIALPR